MVVLSTTSNDSNNNMPYTTNTTTSSSSKHRRRCGSCDVSYCATTTSPVSPTTTTSSSNYYKRHYNGTVVVVSKDNRSFALSAVELIVFSLLLYASIALISGWPLLPPFLLPTLMSPPTSPYQQQQWEDGYGSSLDPYNNNNPVVGYHGDGSGSRQEPQLRFSACEMPSSASGDRIFSLCFGHAICSLAESSWVDSPGILQLDIAQHRMDQLMSAVSHQIKEDVGYGNQEIILSRLLSIPLVCDKMVLTQQELILANERKELMIKTRQQQQYVGGGMGELPTTAGRPTAPQGVLLGGGGHSGGQIYSGGSTSGGSSGS
eukprot:GHVS01034292.1.p1 GENE.GHVS01034292.1~~GHVS01034292.1.p1  ORF type:complete len:318 (-),score=96.59 GHVS01034292.1:93-1046(-)